MHDFFKEFEKADFEQEGFEVYEEERKMKEMDEELSELDAMSEEEACSAYNVNSKKEAEQGIREYWQCIA